MIFCILLGVLNAIGGRWHDIVGEEHARGGRLFFRCLLPAMAAGLYSASIGYGLSQSLYVFLCVAIGLGLWFPWAWDFAAIHGREDLSKWPKWMQEIATFLYPESDKAKQRGTLCICLRGFYLYPMYIMLSAFTSGALVMGLVSGAQGIIYRLCGRLFPERIAVMMAEFFTGALIIGFPLSFTLKGALL